MSPSDNPTATINQEKKLLTRGANRGFFLESSSPKEKQEAAGQN
jgi:hypothetical protein